VQAVEGYLTAMQQRRFADAFDFVSDAMTDKRARDDWSSLQQQFFDRGEIVIDGLEPLSAVSLESDEVCATRAVVPNVLRSRDRFNEDGVIEFELYTVVRDGIHWRVDSQETLYDSPVIHSWFPDIEIVEISMSEGETQ